MKIESMHIYPLKSGKAWGVAEIEISKTGALNDRQWMLVNKKGVFVTQRNNPKISQIELNLVNNDWSLRVGDFSSPIDTSTVSERDIKVWEFSDIGLSYHNPKIENYLAKYLGIDVSLVTLCPKHPRVKSKEFLQQPIDLSLVDGYPVLIATLADLEEINRLAGLNFSMKSFRPNIVLSQTSGDFELSKQNIQIGDIEFIKCQPCKRCVITNIDQDSGEINNPGAFQFLKELQPENATPTFGTYFYAKTLGKIQLSDRVSTRS